MICSYKVLPECKPYSANTVYMELVHDWCFTIDGVDHWIPAGYFIDGASIPMPFWFIGTPFEPRFWAAVFPHDWDYLTHVIPRNIIDEVFRRFLISPETSSRIARIMWASVRTGGYFAWKNDRNDELLLFQLKREIEKRPDHEKFILEAP